MTEQEKKELIELAAKAIGTTSMYSMDNGGTYLVRFHNGECGIFNSLTSTSDRAMLMDELEICVTYYSGSVEAFYRDAEATVYITASEEHNGTAEDRKRAAGLAVTRVAAEIGRRK